MKTLEQEFYTKALQLHVPFDTIDWNTTFRHNKRIEDYINHFKTHKICKLYTLELLESQESLDSKHLNQIATRNYIYTVYIAS